MSRFKGMGGVKVSHKNPSFEPNEKYLVKVVACKHVTNHENNEFFIIEAEIIESTTPKLKTGTIAAQVIGIPGKFRMGFANVKAFLAAANEIDPGDNEAVEEALGVDEDGVDQAVEAAEMAVSDDNPLEGTVLRLQTSLKKTKDGRDFVLHTWMPAA